MWCSDWFEEVTVTFLFSRVFLSGKTHTMSGPDLRDNGAEQMGLIPRIATDLFARIATDSSYSPPEYTVTCSFLEL
jgi:hypothetical protein